MDPTVTLRAKGQTAAFTKVLTNLQAQEAQVVDVGVDRREPVVDRHLRQSRKTSKNVELLLTRASMKRKKIRLALRLARLFESDDLLNFNQVCCLLLVVVSTELKGRERERAKEKSERMQKNFKRGFLSQQHRQQQQQLQQTVEQMYE